MAENNNNVTNTTTPTPIAITVQTTPEQAKAVTGIVGWFKKFGGWILLGLAAIGGLAILIANFVFKRSQTKIDKLQEDNKNIQKDIDIKKEDTDKKIEVEVKKVDDIKTDMKKDDIAKAKDLSGLQGKPSEIIKSINDNFGG